MKIKKIVAAAALSAFIMQMLPARVIAEELAAVGVEELGSDTVSADTADTGLSDEELLRQVDEITESFVLPEVGMGFIELDPDQSAAVIRAIDAQKAEAAEEDEASCGAALYTYHNDYFRDQLNDAEKELYDSWVDICADFMVSSQDITENYPDYVLYDPSIISAERADQIVTYAYYSYPEFFFLNNGTVTGTYGSQGLIAPYVNDNFLTGSFRSQIYNKVVEKTASWLSEINKLPNDLAKERYIAKRICDTVTYTNNYPLDQSLYGSLILENAVCNGYAMEMNYFCNAAGIDCITVVSNNHAWNNVKLFGDWYIVDVTNMDQDDWIYYGWFNVDTATMLKNDSNSSHNIDTALYTGITLPTCTKLDPQVPEVSEIAIDEESFPDAAFRSYVLNNIDTDGSRGLSESEIKKVTYIYVPGTSSKPGTISDLTGIELFPNITSLNCDYNKLTSLDLSRNTALTEVYCSGNSIKSLDVSNNTALEYLWCRNNRLTSLDVSGNTKLTSLVCSDNLLKSLDVSKNTRLTALNCSNNYLAGIDVSKNTMLESLVCTGNVSALGVINASCCLDSYLENFDGSRASNWQGAEYNSKTNTIEDPTSCTITYSYDCGNGYSADFTLKATIVVLQIPQDTTVIEGMDTSLEIKALGTDLTYQWQRYNGSSWVNISGATSSVLAFENVSSDMNGAKYRLKLSCPTYSCTYAGVSLTVKSVDEASEEDVAALSNAETVRFVNLFTEKHSADCFVMTAAQIKAVERVLSNDYAA